MKKQEQRQAVLTIFASLLMLLALPLFLAPASAAEGTIYERRTYEEQRHTIDVAPAPVVRERTVVETVPPVAEKRTTETIVRQGDDDDDNDNAVEEKSLDDEEDDD